MQRRALHLFIVWLGLFVFWVVLSGKLDAVHLGYGVASAAFVTWLSADRLFTRRDDGRDFYLTFLPWGRLLAYVPWLGWEIVKANVQVLKLVFSPLSRLEPSVIRFRVDLKSELSKVVLANSITLTPGTVTLDVTGDGEYVVHAIDGPSADGLLEGAMQRKVAWTFKEEGAS